VDLRSQNRGLSHKFPESWLVSTSNALQSFKARESGPFFQIEILEIAMREGRMKRAWGFRQVCKVFLCALLGFPWPQQAHHKPQFTRGNGCSGPIEFQMSKGTASAAAALAPVSCRPLREVFRRTGSPDFEPEQPEPPRSEAP
jgi:hypothetical protein